MKKVLITDSHPLFREFLKQRLTENQIDVILSQENRDSYTKMITNLPNLVILDMEEDNLEEMEFLERKSEDFNTANIPVIISGPSQDKASVAALAKYGVVKYFTKPIKFDVFFEAVGKVLHTPLSIDTTPCVLDIHRNGQIFFIEIARGLNREKIALLQFKLAEMIEREGIDNPKIIVMLTNLDLTFVDGYNIEFLIDHILAAPHVHNKNVKILSLSKYLKELLAGHENYKGIEVSSRLSSMIGSLVDTTITSSVSDLITERILTSSGINDGEDGSVATKFSADKTKGDSRAEEDDGTILKVAIVDSDLNSLAITKQAFEAAGAETTIFTTGQAFTESYENGKYNLVIVDVFLSDNTGISLLQYLTRRQIPPVTVVYSAIPKQMQQDILKKIISTGTRNIIQKPQKPNILVQKCFGFLKGNL